jgi:hypothetical protein
VFRIKEILFLKGKICQAALKHIYEKLGQETQNKNIQLKTIIDEFGSNISGFFTFRLL